MKTIWKKHKWKIVVPAIVICILAFAFWYGGNAPGLHGWEAATPSPSVSDSVVMANHTGIAPTPDTDASSSAAPSALPVIQSTPTPSEASPGEASPTEAAGETSAEPSPEPSPKPSVAPGADSGHQLSADEKKALAQQLAGGESSDGVMKGDAGYSEEQGMAIDPATGKDQYGTDPVPEGRPIPVEPEDAVITDTAHTCILSIRCDTILDNISWLDPDKVELVPSDGVIFATATVTFYDGESVFNVLQREMKKARIHMEFRNTPMYNSAYIEGINNLYEFDCGELSGWMYKVNNWFPNYGCSRYQLHEGDVIEWAYTCNLGIDVGGYYAVGG
jgi:hypothetical protein